MTGGVEVVKQQAKVVNGWTTGASGASNFRAWVSKWLMLEVGGPVWVTAQQGMWEGQAEVLWIWNHFFAYIRTVGRMI